MSEKSISVSNIASRRAEGFYWTAVLFSNTLGTALGISSLTLGFTGGALLIGSLIALTALASRIKGINRVILFWIAFVLTRPFGATFGDPLKAAGKGRPGLRYGRLVAGAVHHPVNAGDAAAAHNRPANARSSPHPPAAPCR